MSNLQGLLTQEDYTEFNSVQSIINEMSKTKSEYKKNIQEINRLNRELTVISKKSLDKVGFKSGLFFGIHPDSYKKPTKIIMLDYAIIKTIGNDNFIALFGNELQKNILSKSLSETYISPGAFIKRVYSDGSTGEVGPEITLIAALENRKRYIDPGLALLKDKDGFTLNDLSKSLRLEQDVSRDILYYLVHKNEIELVDEEQGTYKMVSESHLDHVEVDFLMDKIRKNATHLNLSNGLVEISNIVMHGYDPKSQKISSEVFFEYKINQRKMRYLLLERHRDETQKNRIIIANKTLKKVEKNVFGDAIKSGYKVNLLNPEQDFSTNYVKFTIL